MSHIWERAAYIVSVGNPEGKRPLRRHKNRREDVRIHLNDVV
jgi:hypothetical protein